MIRLFAYVSNVKKTLRNQRLFFMITELHDRFPDYELETMDVILNEIAEDMAKYGIEG